MGSELQAVGFTDFKGLRLDLPLDEVGSDSAIDLLDVDWNTSTGFLSTRMGSARFSEKTSQYTTLGKVRVGSFTYLISQRSETTLVAIRADSGAETATTAFAGASRLAVSPFGTPSATYAYIGPGALKRFDGAAFTSPKATVDGVAEKAMPSGTFLATWQDGGNRLVVCTPAGATGPGGATSSASHVWFSEPGNAEAYESTAYVQLTPGDAEGIQGCCVWGGQVFIFKKNKFFVFYGVSVDEEGKPVFNYRTVEIGGAEFLTPKFYGGETVVAGKDAVYFLTDAGLYATSGGSPVKVSGALDGLQDGRTLIGPAKATLEGEERQLHLDNMIGIVSYQERLFIPAFEITAKEGTGPSISRLFIYDLRTGEWLVWSAKIKSIIAAIGSLYFSSWTGGIHRYDIALNTDEHAPMEPTWQSGFYDLDSQDEKTLEHLKFWGSGNLNLKVAKDFGALGAATALKLGVAPAIAQTRANKSQTGTLFSHQFSGAAPWSVQRMARYLRETRVAATKTK